MPDEFYAGIRKALSPGRRIAVVGSGAAGLGAALALSARHEVHLFEAEQRLGGHCNTIIVNDPSGHVPVDTGFIVFNTVNYPTLTRAFDYLGVPSEPSDMSFSVSTRKGAFEYAGSFPGGLLAQPGNLVRPRFWRMLSDIRRFYACAIGDLDDAEERGESLGDWVARHGYSRAFRDDHIAPMAAAIWSQPQGAVLDMPVATLIRFFSAHGLLKVRNRPRWRTVSGGSRVYVDAIARRISGEIHAGTPIVRVSRGPEGVVVTTGTGDSFTFEAAVVASHADQALPMLATPGHGYDPRREVLGAFSYQSNRAIVHRDPALMPKRRAAWASWNYVAPEGADGPQGVTYWMNRLQNLNTTEPIFVTLNPPFAPAENAVIAEFDYMHPVFDRDAIAAQQRLAELQGRDGIWLCGSYFGYGFHEDAFASGIHAAEAMGVPAPWTPGMRFNMASAV